MDLAAIDRRPPVERLGFDPNQEGLGLGDGRRLMGSRVKLASEEDLAALAWSAGRLRGHLL